MSMPSVRVDTKFIHLGKGLDQVSAATLTPEGYVIDAQNYEIDSINGGYARVNGYERFDGTLSPSSATYLVIPSLITGSIEVGDVITGVSSSATGTVLAVDGGNIVVGAVAGSFDDDEDFQVGGVTQAQADGQADTAPDQALHAQYSFLSAELRRGGIQPVPGEGAILGVWLYKDVVYAFRNKVGGATAGMYKATNSGWTEVAPGFKQIAFSTGMVKPAEGAILHGNTSSAKGVVKRIVTRTGSWGSNATGHLVIQITSGTFQSGETLKLTDGSGVVQCTATSAATDIVLAPGGRYEFANYNFTGSSDNWRMYWCDGVNTAFEFDGSVLVPISTGMDTDTPSHIATHKNYLFLSFKGSLQNSAVGDPYGWNLLTGASEIGAGDEITALLAQPGDANTAALAVFTKSTTRTLYGNSPSDWKLALNSPTTGGVPGTAQHIGTAFALAERGVQQISATDVFGDFQFATITGKIQPLINRLRGTAIASTVFKERNQYRLFFSNGVGLAFTMAGNNLVGVMLTYYPKPPTCYVTGNKSDGSEYSYFGASDGYVCQDNIGTSFDGEEIEYWLRMPYHHFGSPRYIKTFRRATLDLVVSGYSGFSVGHELAGGDFRVDSGSTQGYEATGGYWDQFSWDSFTWDSSAVLSPVYDLYGSEKNVSMIFYGNSTIYSTHSIQGVHFDYTLRRLARA